MITRQAAWDIVCKFVKDPGLRRHMLAVEAAMRGYAEKLAGDPEAWGQAGLLHDFDWEIHPTLETHVVKGVPILRERGVDENIITAILSHNHSVTAMNPSRPIDFALLACDEITGLIIATALVRPSKNIHDVELKSVQKKWKAREFAAGVHRDEVEAATAAFSKACFDGGLDLWQHVANVLASMQSAAGELELDGRAAAC
ncbi:MAG TPA: HDIG domain-containing metalloprotein [Humisphaera sp.]|jgi:putative nucleotidyltransferase with HDIG domain|nr:HDIG domain-containing metalloprotein [Humisphaera sp.]